MKTTKEHAVAADHSVAPDGWMVIFNEAVTWIAGRFGPVEPRRSATAYVRGLLADIDRKNCWNPAEHAALNGPQTLQRLLPTARRDADAVRNDVRAFAVDRLGPGGVLIVDGPGSSTSVKNPQFTSVRIFLVSSFNVV